MENRSLKPFGPLKPCGLSSDWSKAHYTFFSRVQFPEGKTIQKFYEDLNKGMMTETLAGLVKTGRIRLKMVAIVFGDADAIIVWQAKDAKAAKHFRDTILTGDPVTMVALSGDGHDG